MVATLGKDTPSYATIKDRWQNLRVAGRDLRMMTSPHPTQPEIATIVHDMVMDDRQVTERYIASAVEISQERVNSILMDDLI